MFLEFKDKYEEYFKYLERIGRNRKTIYEHRRMLCDWFPKKFQNKWVSRLKRADIALLKEVGRQHGEHGETRAVVVFRRYADFLQTELNIKLPFDWRDVKVPTVPDREQPVFEDHELVTLFNVMETMEIGSVHGRRLSWTMQAFFETLFGAGFRIHEALKLKRADFSRIKETERFVLIGKGDVEREVVFSMRAIEKLEQYLSKRNDTSDAMFVNSCGEPLIMATARSYFERMKKKLRRLGFDVIADKLRSHTFRRTLGTHLFENGATIKDVQYLLGHKSDRTTTRHYIRTNKRLAQRVHKHILDKFPFQSAGTRYREIDGKIQIRLTENLGRWMTIKETSDSGEIHNQALQTA